MFSFSTTESILVVETHRTRLRGFVSAVVGLIMVMFSSSVWSATLLYDNFNAYPADTGIAGQGGWYALNPNQAPIIVSTGSGLGSLVLNGGIRTGDGSYTDPNLPFVLRSLPAALSAAATGTASLSADAYAFSDYRSHNAGVGFSSADLSVGFMWYANWYGTLRGTPKWTFYGFGISDISTFLGGFDQPIRLGVIIDGAAGEVYGRLTTHSGGTFETTHSAITPAQIASLTKVVIFEDFRDSLYLGVEYDNISVSTGRLPFVGSSTITNGPGCLRGHATKTKPMQAEAIDYYMPVGTPIYAYKSGSVEVAGRQGKNAGFGTFVKILHPNEDRSYYAHLSQLAVTVGDRVKQGQLIGYSGNSGGKSTGPHLHFQVLDRDDVPVSIRTLPETFWNSGDANDPCQRDANDSFGYAVGPPVR